MTAFNVSLIYIPPAAERSDHLDLGTFYAVPTGERLCRVDLHGGPFRAADGELHSNLKVYKTNEHYQGRSTYINIVTQ